MRLPLDLVPLADDGLPADGPRLPATDARGNVLIRLVTFLGVVLVIGSLGLGASLLLPDEPAWIGATVTSVALITAALAGYLVMVLWLEDRRPPIELALRRWAGAAIGLGTGIVLMLLCAGIVGLLGGWQILGWGDGSWGMWLGSLLWVVVFPAIVEEIAFRGVLFRLVEQVLGSWAALGVSAALFGAAHVLNPHASVVSTVAIAVEAGLLLGAVYLLTRSLWWVIGLHAGVNLTQTLLLGLPVSGQRNPGLIRSDLTGHPLLSGGQFGLEASLVTVVVLVTLATTGLLVAHRRGMIVMPVWQRRSRGEHHGLAATKVAEQDARGRVRRDR